MAAYAALVSLMNLIDQIQNHPRPPITLHQTQVESLSEKIAFLEEFLEAYNTCDGDQELDRLRSGIVDAAYAAEDVIESHIVDQITQPSNFRGDNIISLRTFFEEAAEDVATHVVGQTLAQSSTHDGETIGSVDLYQGLQKVIQDMDSIKKDVMEIKNNVGSPDQLQRIITTSESLSTKKNTMMDFNNGFLNEILDKLTGGHSGRQIISISGMGGIGKTTFARNVFEKPLIKQHFDVLVWVTFSQEYNIREILLEILLCLKNQGNKESLNQKSEQDLGLQLYQYLIGRRYLIIMDDVWSVEAWDELRSSFPDNNDGSRIVITTRISKLARDLSVTVGVELSFLNEDESWDLFRKIVFGEQGCPDELEQVGKEIAINCKGLPLSIVVIGGLLVKSKQTQENWKFIAENLNSVVNSDDNERCLRILRTSYNQLPIHLKPCFLLMGSFPEDKRIDASKLVKQWVAEGFIKPSKTKILEEIAEEYLRDLMERNLIILANTNRSYFSDSIKPIFYEIHDLLRDLCQREARKDKFLYVTSQHQLHIIPHDISTQRRIAIFESACNEEYQPQVLHASKSASFARSLTCNFGEFSLSLGFRLLRVLKVLKVSSSRKRLYPMVDIIQQMNSRYLDVTGDGNSLLISPTSIHLFWNLQTLIVSPIVNADIELSNFWTMSQLRHVQVRKLFLPHPCRQDDFVMENLQTLLRVYNFSLSEEVVKRIPNIKVLLIEYDEDIGEFEVASHYCLNNLDRLHKLEYLKVHFNLHLIRNAPYFFPLQNMSFPNSLKQLYLSSCSIDLDEINIKIGSLPFLESLSLRLSIFPSSKWETIDGQFTSLKHLHITSCNLECWTTENTHFPRLESLNLYGLQKLREIDLDIGGLPTLKLFFFNFCSVSAVIFAKRIAEEQEENGNEDFQVKARISRNSRLKELVSSNNFHVEIW